MFTVSFLKTLAGTIAMIMLASTVSADTSMLIGYLRIEQERPPTLSNLDPIPEDNGLAGAKTGLEDNITTGRFLQQSYEMIQAEVLLGEDPRSTAQALLAQTPYLVIHGDADSLREIADLPEAANAILFNISAAELSLRDVNCRPNLLHTAASNAMRTDALAQLFVKKRWSDLVLITGPHPRDQSYAEAMRRSLVKFGLKLQDEKQWNFDTDMRRTAAQEVPLFTQDFGDYDALILADEEHDFGRYVLYNTWAARPVVGSEGLSALAWSPVIEQWGAAQLHSRFEAQNGREMSAQDYAAWAAIRTLGEAMTRTSSSDPETLKAYILSDHFELAGFKGRALTYRIWNGQLRQPIALAHPRALVAQAPLDGFLHQHNELDSLGLDRPESQCEAFQ
jgi:ABC transporter substrate binding protein (PQQ-dependent alcohol dehydrogenase system)